MLPLKCHYSNGQVREEPARLSLKREHPDESPDEYLATADRCGDECSTSPEYPPISSKIQGKTQQTFYDSSSWLKEDYSESCNSTQDFDSQITSNDSLTTNYEEFGVIEERIAGIEEQITALMVLREQGKRTWSES